MPIVSHKLKFIGIADVVEFKQNDNGVPIHNYKELYNPYVVEYKKGKPKKNNPDISQLVAQVICIEEMFNVEVLESAIYYKQINKRIKIKITQELKNQVIEIAKEMKKIYESKETPKAKVGKNCKRCSILNCCMPRLTHHKKSVVNYVNKHVNKFDDEARKRKE
jgi:CRISPR-associated exonuclease Cas4